MNSESFKIKEAEKTKALRPGDKITYTDPASGTVQKGIVKSIRDNRIYCVFGLKHPEDWERYFDFTSSLTPVEKITIGWG